MKILDIIIETEEKKKKNYSVFLTHFDSSSYENENFVIITNLYIRIHATVSNIILSSTSLIFSYDNRPENETLNF